MCRHLEDGSSFDGFRISLDLLGLFCCSPLNFTMLWSSYACRPSGYLNVAWSQSPINQISSDLAGLADKTLHGRRKWQTVGDKRPACWDAMKRDWSTAPQTPSGCLHEFCLIWFSFWFLSLWRVTLFPSQSNSVTKFSLSSKKSTIFKRSEWTFKHYTIMNLSHQLWPPKPNQISWERHSSQLFLGRLSPRSTD